MFLLSYLFVMNVFIFLFTCSCYCIFLYMDSGLVDTFVLHTQATHKSPLVFTGSDLGEF